MQRELSKLALRAGAPRPIGESWCRVSINGGSEREVDQAEPGEEAHGEEGSQTRNGQSTARRLSCHRSKGKTVFQDGEQGSQEIRGPSLALDRRTKC